MTAEELLIRHEQEIRAEMRSSIHFFAVVNAFVFTCAGLTFILPAYTWYAAAGAVFGAGLAVARSVRDVRTCRERAQRFRVELASLRAEPAG